MPKQKPLKKISAKSGAVSGGKNFSNQITKLLDQAKIKYKTLEHKVVYTAHDAAATTKKKLSEIAKVVLVRVDLPRVAKNKTDKSWALIIVPAGKYVDLNGVKKALQAKKVSLASEKDIVKYLKTKIGLLHPFGHLFKIPTLLDKSLTKAKRIITSAGSYTHSIELAIKDFDNLAKPLKGIFSKAKK